MTMISMSDVAKVITDSNVYIGLSDGPNSGEDIDWEIMPYSRIAKLTGEPIGGDVNNYISDVTKRVVGDIIFLPGAAVDTDFASNNARIHCDQLKSQLIHMRIIIGRMIGNIGNTPAIRLNGSCLFDAVMRHFEGDRPRRHIESVDILYVSDYGRKNGWSSFICGHPDSYIYSGVGIGGTVMHSGDSQMKYRMTMIPSRTF